MDTTIVAIKESIASLAAHMDDVKKAVARMERMDEKQTKILEMLASNKTEHEQMQNDIQILRDRTHASANAEQAMPYLKEKIDRGEWRLDQLEITLGDFRAETNKSIGKAVGTNSALLLIIGWVMHALGWI